MTHQPWTTPEQMQWLEERKEIFLEAKQKDTTSKDFFPLVCKEFREKWPVAPVTEYKTSKAGSTDLAMKAKRESYDKVHLLFQERETNLTKAYIAYMKLVSQQHT
jgi:hypothetical protein